MQARAHLIHKSRLSGGFLFYLTEHRCSEPSSGFGLYWRFFEVGPLRQKRATEDEGMTADKRLSILEPSRAALLGAIDLLTFLVALLSIHRKGRDRPSLEPLQRDRLAGFLAITVVVVLDPLQCGVNL